MLTWNGCLHGLFEPLRYYVHEAGRKSEFTQQVPQRNKKAFCGAHTRWCPSLRDESGVSAKRGSTSQKSHLSCLFALNLKPIQGTVWKDLFCDRQLRWHWPTYCIEAC